MNTMILQWGILAVIFFLACYSIFKMIKKNFSSDKFDKDSSCGKNCGCS